jgi:menaquinone-9 beta-reductase
VRGAAVSAPLIIGGGPAGAAVAISLAQAGRAVTLIERHAGAHHKVCGDFLSADAVRLIGELGVDLAPLCAAPIVRVRIVRGTAEASAALPFPALGLSRMALDEALLARAGGAGAQLLRGAAVRALHRCGEGFVVDAGAHGRWAAGTVFLGTGKHDLRGAARPWRGAELVGLKTYLALAAEQARALAGAVELVLFPGGYAGLMPVEAGRVVLCWLMPRAVLRRLDAWPAALEWLLGVCPHLAQRLAGSVPLLAKPVAVAGIPYGFVHRGGDGGLFRLGDQAGVIPSLAGDGVAIALTSGRLAAEAWLSGEGLAVGYHRRLRRKLERPVRLAGAAHQLVRSAAMQSWAVAVCRRWPGLLASLATATRIGDG